MNWFRFIFGMGGGGGGAGCGPMSVAATVAQGISKGPSVEESLERLEARKENCIKSIEVIEKRIGVKNAFMQKHGKDPSKKTACMQALREKRQLEKDLAVKTGTLEKLTAAISTLNRNLDHADTVDVLSEANQAMKALAADPSIQNADEVMVELEHNMEEQEDLNMVMAKPLQGSSTVDELDLEKELEALGTGEEAVQQTSVAAAARRAGVTAPVQPQMMMAPPASSMYSNGTTAATAKPAAAPRDRMKEIEGAVSV